MMRVANVRVAMVASEQNFKNPNTQFFLIYVRIITN